MDSSSSSSSSCNVKVKAELRHAVVIPHPLQGHITPALHLCHHLAAFSHHQIFITLLLPQHLLSTILHLHPPNPNLSFHGVSDSLPLQHPRNQTFLHAYEVAMAMEASVEELLADLTHVQVEQKDQKEQKDQEERLWPPSPDFIISDAFIVWAHDLALKFSIPSVAFVTTNATAMMLMTSIPKLIQLGILPIKAEHADISYLSSMITEEEAAEAEKDLITCFPSLPPLHPCELPASMKSLSLDHYRIKFIKSQFEQATKAAAVIVNTVEEIEKEVLDGLEFAAPVYAVGPALLLDEAKENPNTTTCNAGSLWPVQNECLSWLDKQDHRSVVYVAFGSMLSFEKPHFVELALGLEASKRPFLWVVPPYSYRDSVSEVLPDGFIERMQGVGMVISWSPQTLVLSHPSLGAFITHCGWNSLLENLCLGAVPMICWPDAAEQAVNAKLVTDVWKVGVRVRTRKNRLVHRDEVVRVVNLMFLHDEINGFKARALELKDAVSRAVQLGGSSLKNIDKVIDIVKRAKARRFLEGSD